MKKTIAANTEVNFYGLFTQEEKEDLFGKAPYKYVHIHAVSADITYRTNGKPAAVGDNTFIRSGFEEPIYIRKREKLLSLVVGATATDFYIRTS